MYFNLFNKKAMRTTIEKLNAPLKIKFGNDKLNHLQFLHVDVRPALHYPGYMMSAYYEAGLAGRERYLVKNTFFPSAASVMSAIAKAKQQYRQRMRTDRLYVYKLW
jgi:hypothetical protein